jgi:hypothetical protein
MEKELHETSFFRFSVMSSFKYAFSLSSDQVQAATPPGTIAISGKTIMNYKQYLRKFLCRVTVRDTNF